MYSERERLVSKVMVILELLNDGKWHGTEDLLLTAGLCERKFLEITGFLTKYGFVMVDDKNRKMKINKDFQRLLAQPII